MNFSRQHQFSNSFAKIRVICGFVWAAFLLAPLAAFAQDASSATGSYVLQQLDAVSVSVFGEEDLSTVQRIDGDGNIRVPLLGVVKLEGRTVREAETFIEERFVADRYLRNPDVSVTVQAYEGKFINVLGQVNGPGRVRLPDEAESMLLVDVISSVGGFNGIAKTDAVKITSKNKDGSESVRIINVDQIIAARDAGKEADPVRIYPGDIIFVPERLF